MRNGRLTAIDCRRPLGRCSCGFLKRLEARPGIEPGCTDLQSAASPLRHRAIRVSTRNVGGGGRSIQEPMRARNWQIAGTALARALALLRALWASASIDERLMILFSLIGQRGEASARPGFDALDELGAIARHDRGPIAGAGDRDIKRGLID